MITHASIVPLIGGMTIGQSQAFETPPKYLMSYDAFGANDQHCVEYFNVPYYLNGEHGEPVDIINAVCPCAGLSTLSYNPSSDRTANTWMVETAKLVLGEIKPKVFWGENAPGFIGKNGKPIINKLRNIAKENGYKMSVYATSSLRHGLPQTRNRCFYFFWRDSKIPKLNFIERPHKKLEDVILECPKTPTMNELANIKTPTEDPYYRIILEYVHPGMKHHEFVESITKTTNPLTYCEKNNISYEEMSKWCRSMDLEKAATKIDYISAKIAAGKNYMNRFITIPKDFFGAFVCHLPTVTTHPVEDRFLTIRECLHMMGMPNDFELIGGKKNLNHIAQNVPVGTAKDVALEIKKYLNNELDFFEGEFVIQYNKKNTKNLVFDRFEEFYTEEVEIPIIDESSDDIEIDQAQAS